MKIDNIERLKINKERRSSEDGYLSDKHKSEIRINVEGIRVINGGLHANFGLNPFIGMAILEMEEQLLKRAFELEEEAYEKIKKAAKIEAANIIAM